MPWFSKMSSPVALSLVSTDEVTLAALPLSRTSTSLAWLTIVAPVGIGFRIRRYCSPCSSLAGLKLGTKSSNGTEDDDPNCGITPKVGRAYPPVSPRSGLNHRARADLEVVRVLIHPLQLVGLGADTEVVQDDVPLGVADFRRRDLELLGLLDCIGVLRVVI